jgi:hypothetical protein
LDKQIAVRSLTKKLIDSEITDEEPKTLLDRLDNEVNIIIFLEVLSGYRAKNSLNALK